MTFGLKQDDLIKYAIGGVAAIGITALLIGVNNPQLSEPSAPVKRGSSAKPYTGTGGAGGFDVSQAYYGDDEDDDYDSYLGEDDGDDEDDYYSYPADIVVGDHTGHPGPGMPPGGHPGPGSGGGGPPHPGPGGDHDGHPGSGGSPWLHPGTFGHPGGPAGFRLGNRPFPLKRYHFTNNLWRIFGNRLPGWGGIFPGTPQLGYPYHPQTYPFFTSPFQCHRFPWSLMPQCRRFRPQPFHFPWGRGFQWGHGRPGLPGHPGFPGHGFPGGHPGPGPH
jgi:hypothetical protein